MRLTVSEYVELVSHSLESFLHKSLGQNTKVHPEDLAINTEIYVDALTAVLEGLAIVEFERQKTEEKEWESRV